MQQGATATDGGCGDPGGAEPIEEGNPAALVQAAANPIFRTTSLRGAIHIHLFFQLGRHETASHIGTGIRSNADVVFIGQVANNFLLSLDHELVFEECIFQFLMDQLGKRIVVGFEIARMRPEVVGSEISLRRKDRGVLEADATLARSFGPRCPQGTSRHQEEACQA